MRYSNFLTVVTPAADYALVDLATVKEEFDITTDTGDSRLTRWTLDATSAIQGYIGRVLRSESVIETFRANAMRYGSHGEHFSTPYSIGGDFAPASVPGLRLQRYPIVTVGAIVEDGTTLDAAQDYEIDAESGIIYRLSSGYRVAWYGQVIAVSYAGGYAAPSDVPSDIQTACLTLLKHRTASRTRDPTLKALTIPGVIEQQFWVGTMTDSALPPEVESLIRRYRDVHL